MSLPCAGNGDEHCCWVAGKPCPHLEENTVPGRRWACGLYRHYGDWTKVITSDAYCKDVAPTFDKAGINCRDWPTNKKWCNTCGAGK